MFLPSRCQHKDDYADMNRDGLIRLIVYLRKRLEEAEAARKENDRRISGLPDRISGLTGLFRKSNENMSATAVQVSELMKLLKEKDGRIAELQSMVKAGRKKFPGASSGKNLMPSPFTITANKLQNPTGF